MNNNLTILIISIILLTTLILILVLYSPHKRENYRKKDNDNTIFISLANYRDDDCKNTLAHIFENAKYPENIFVGGYISRTVTFRGRYNILTTFFATGYISRLVTFRGST